MAVVYLVVIVSWAVGVVPANLVAGGVEGKNTNTIEKIVTGVDERQHK